MMQNVTVIVLFILPMITMRTYAEKSGRHDRAASPPASPTSRSSRASRALALYATMLAVTTVHVAVLFFSSPEWKPIDGLCGAAAARPVSSQWVCRFQPDEKPGHRGVVTFGLRAAAVGDQLVSNFATGMVGTCSVICRSSTTSTILKGVIDTTHIIYYLSFIAFGLPDRQVSRQRTVAWLMTNRIFSLIGWLGTAFVVAALAIAERPRWPAVGRHSIRIPCVAGLACMLVYTLSQWREYDWCFEAPGAGTHVESDQCGRHARSPGRDQLHRHQQQALGPHGSEAARCPIRAEHRVEARLADADHGIRQGV